MSDELWEYIIVGKYGEWGEGCSGFGPLEDDAYALNSLWNDLDFLSERYADGRDEFHVERRPVGKFERIEIPPRPDQNGTS